MSDILITAFKWVPPFAQGLVRDLRVRWALEEAGLEYRENLLEREEQNSPAHRAVQPFGQIPVFEQDGLRLFESGAIVLHIAAQCPLLLPTDPARRARATCWMFAALNSVEPQVQNLASMDLFHADKEWAKLRRPEAQTIAQSRLAAVAAALEGKEYLDGEFTAGDLLMTTVLRILRHTPMVAGMPTLAAYQARCEARPAFQRALSAQLRPFSAFAPAN